MSIKTCSKCHKTKDISEFREYKKGKFRAECKICANEGSKQWFLDNHEYAKKRNGNRTLNMRLFTPWIQHLYSARQRCTNPKNDSYKKYGQRGIKCLLTKEDIEHLWYRDNAELMKEPCIDRIDTNGHYVLDNCQFLDKFVHDKKTSTEYAKEAKKVVQLSENKEIIKIWDSQSQILKQSGFWYTSLLNAINKNKLYKGFYWQHL